jgi:hypothetical protein
MIEAVFRHRKRKGRGVQNGYAVGKTNSSIEFARSDEEFRRQVHSSDMTAISLGDPSGGTGNAATDIEQVIARFRLQQRSQLLGCGRTAAVKMIDRREGVRSDFHVRSIHVS